jgi:hypothetical protein
MQRPTMDGHVVRELARCMQMRMAARSALMHKHTAGPPPARLGDRDCHIAQGAIDNRTLSRRYLAFGDLSLLSPSSA